MFHVCFYLRHLDDENMVCILPTQTVLWQPYMLGYVIDADGAMLLTVAEQRNYIMKLQGLSCPRLFNQFFSAFSDSQC